MAPGGDFSAVGGLGRCGQLQARSEIEEVPGSTAQMQRVLGDIRRVGGSRTIDVDIRVIAACDQAPALLVQKKLLRRDLYYRLNESRIAVPPLRNRLEDIRLPADSIGRLAAESHLRAGLGRRSFALTQQTFSWSRIAQVTLAACDLEHQETRT